MDFTLRLLSWYKENKRNLPWRNTSNPYYIWLSEIILQQTRVEQGLPYYHSFVTAFPTLKDLATATEDKVLKLWQGLGYYSRARNLHAAAKTIYFDCNNEFPQNYNDIIKLKGVGPYTAAAIASFAFKEPVAVVDGNVFRVLSRYFGMYEDIAVAKNRNIFQNLANELISKKHPDLFNHAIMDFGATICTPANPKCNSCPFNDNCFAFLKNDITSLPVKTKKIKVKDRFLNYMILQSENEVALQQRTDKDIWQHLYEFPLMETTSLIEENVFEQLSQMYPASTIIKLTKQPIKHKLSHQQLHIDFYLIHTTEFPESLEITRIDELHQFAFPIVIWNFIKDFFKLDKF